MRPLSLIGIVLLAVGAYLTFAGGRYTSREDVLKVGDVVKVEADTKKAIPTWVGGVAIVAGVVLIAAGMKRRRT